MQLGMVGLGRMGANMVRRLVGRGHRCVVHDVRPEAVKALADEAEGIEPAGSLAELAEKLAPPRHVWIMRSEERRVGEEWRSRWGACPEKKGLGEAGGDCS